MRKIKFRAWDKCKRKMCSVDFIKFSKVQYTQISFSNIEENKIIYQDSSLLDKNMFGTCVLMQYTGLKDKNGVEIYEGDILKEYNMYEYRMKPDWSYDDRVNAVNHIVKIGEYKQDGSGDEYCPSKCLGVYAELTKFYKDYFYEHKFTKTLFELNEFEVIGNIYENPKLLEKKESDEE